MKWRAVSITTISKRLDWTWKMPWKTSKKVQKPAKKKVVKRSILKDIGNIKTSSVLDDIIKEKEAKPAVKRSSKAAKDKVVDPENEKPKKVVSKKPKVNKKKEIVVPKGQMKMTAFFRI